MNTSRRFDWSDTGFSTRLLYGALMNEETRQSRSIKIKPSILRKARHRAIDSQKRLGQWLEEAIEEKAKRGKAK